MIRTIYNQSFFLFEEYPEGKAAYLDHPLGPNDSRKGYYCLAIAIPEAMDFAGKTIGLDSDTPHAVCHTYGYPDGSNIILKNWYLAG